MGSLDNVVWPHKSLRPGRTRRTPALAMGLTDPGGRSRESRWLPVHANPALTQPLADRRRQRRTPALQDQPRGRTQAAFPPAEAREVPEDEAGTRPKAA